PVAGEDGPPGLGVVADDRPDVAGVVGQAVGPHDLEVVELHEQGEEAGENGQAHPAHLAVHAHDCAPVVATAEPGAASDRRATSSEIRSSRARITKLATSDDPP